MGLPHATEQAYRETGIDLLGPVPAGTHVCQFYQTPEDLARVVVPYFKAGLENGEACVWITPDFLPPPDAADILRQAVPDLDERISRGQMEIIPAGDWYVPDGVFDAQTIIERWAGKFGAATSAGYEFFRACGDSSWSGATECEELLTYERAIGPLMAGQPGLALCTYPLNLYTAPQTVELMDLHSSSLVTHNGAIELIEISTAGQTRESLSKELAFTSAILDLAPCSISVIDRLGRVLFANQAVEDICGIRAADMIGKPISQIRFHAGKSDMVEALFKHCMESGSDVRIERDWTAPDGTHRAVALVSRVVADPSGEYLVTIGTDITAHRETEDKFRESQDRLQRVLESITQGYYLLDSEWRFVDANPVAEKHFGRTLDELRQMTIWDAAPLPPGTPAHDAFHKALAENKPVHIELESRLRPGMWSELHAYPRDGMLEIYFREITERKQAEEELRRSEERFRSVLESSRDNIYRINVQTGRYEYLSPSAELMTGYSVAEFMAMDPETRLAMIHPDDLPALLASFARLEENGTAEVVYRQRIKSGEYRWFSCHMSLTRDSAGRPLYRNGNIRDITRRKQIEQALRESEERLALAQGVADIATWDWNITNGTITYSENYRKVYGLPADAPLPSVEQWTEMIHPDDRERVSSEMTLGMKTGATMGSEFRIVWPSGDIHWIACKAMVFHDTDGRPVRAVGANYDITERRLAEQAIRESEEQFRQLAENVRDIFWMTTPDFETVLYVSPAYEEICGRTACELYKNPSLMIEAVLPEDQDTLLTAMAAHSEGADSTSVEYRIRRPDGSIRWLHDRSFAVRDAAGEVCRIAGIAEDITERKRAEERLLKNHERDRVIAGTLQKAILPTIDMSVDGFGIAGMYKPAFKEAEVGGDFYDLFKLPDGRTGFVIGDVSGKGVQAAVHTAMAKYMLRAYACQDPDPACVLRQLNRAICEYSADEIFITVVYAALDPATRVITYANAGHDKPLLYRSETCEVVPLDTTGGLLGVVPEIPYDKRTIQLSPGDFMLLYTDGITDARDEQDFFDEDRLCQVVAANAHCGEDHIVEAVYLAAREHAQGDLGDDAAILVLRARK